MIDLLIVAIYMKHIHLRRGSFPNRKVQKATIAQFLLKMESGYCETNYSNFTKLESNFKRNEYLHRNPCIFQGAHLSTWG